MPCAVLPCAVRCAARFWQVLPAPYSLRVDDTLIIEEIVTFTRHDGTTVVVPAATVCELTDGLADRLQTYIDVSPLFANAQAPALCRAREGAIA